MVEGVSDELIEPGRQNKERELSYYSSVNRQMAATHGKHVQPSSPSNQSWAS
jgi:hypothetical protein